jgi:hypothetical protein
VHGAFRVRPQQLAIGLNRLVESGFADARLKSSMRITPQRGPVAQLAEQQTLNLRVEGSIPSWLTT